MGATPYLFTKRCSVVNELPDTVKHTEGGRPLVFLCNSLYSYVVGVFGIDLTVMPLCSIATGVHDYH